MGQNVEKRKIKDRFSVHAYYCAGGTGLFQCVCLFDAYVPSSSQTETWIPYTNENGACMILDEKPYMAYHHDDNLLKLLGVW